MTRPLTLPSRPKRGRGIQRERRDCFLPSPPVGGKDSKRAPGLFPSLSLSRREGFKESAGTVSSPSPRVGERAGWGGRRLGAVREATERRESGMGGEATVG